jgi:uncharacterized protein YaiE (UPF0345 family)
MAQGILAHLNLFRTDNNIKRSLASLVGAVLSSDNVTSTAVTIAGSGTYTFTPASPNQLVVVGCSSPVVADVTIPAAGGGTPAGGSFTKTIQSLLVLDVGVTSIVFTNPTSDPLNLVLVSG